MADRFALISSRVVTPDDVRAAAVVVEGGRIEAILPREETPAGASVDDVGNLVVSPGLVDSHVHINEPGRDGLGRIRNGDAGGGGWRRDDACGYAAEQLPRDDDGRGAGGQTASRPGQMLGRRGVSRRPGSWKP